MKMMKINLIRLTIWFLFVISSLSHSLSHAHQDEEGLGSIESIQQRTFHGLRKIGIGRKTTAKEIFGNDEERKDNSQISGANHSDSTCNFEDQKGNFRVMNRKMGTKDYCKKINDAKKLKDSVFVAFGADYKGPFHHPPKHN